MNIEISFRGLDRLKSILDKNNIEEDVKQEIIDFFNESEIQHYEEKKRWVGMSFEILDQILTDVIRRRTE